MISKLKITIFTIFCGLIFMSFGVSAQNTATPKTPDKTTKPSPTPVAKESKIELPEIEGWERSAASEDVENYIVNYDSKSVGRVTIYVYTRGLENIPNGVSDDLIKDELEGAKGAILQLAEMGIYQDVKEGKTETVTLGGASGKVKSLQANLSMTIKGQNYVSEIYLFGHQNKFVKIRATRGKDQGEAGKQAMADFLATLDKTFSN